MLRKLFILLLITSFSIHLHSQHKISQNIVVVTMDGLRWQELFGGADSLLSFDTTASYGIRYIQRKYWAATSGERRKKLMPFMWSVIAQNGTILGNRDYNNFVNNANPYWFSYPGYNEIFTGYPDKGVNSNDKIPNPNENVFEFLNKMPYFKGKAAVFGSWSVFASIFNEGRSGILVNDGFRDLPGKLTPLQEMHNKQQHELPDLFHGGERLDFSTFNIGFEYMKIHKPRLIFFGLGDTDEFAHAGQYDFYLGAIQQSDKWIRRLWEYIQSTPFYANKTTLIITTDHGRGEAAGGKWKSHGEKIPGADQMWIAAIGPSVPAAGESKTSAQFYQGQIAATIARWLGKTFTPAHEPLKPLELPSK